jgi:serine/threonine protein kinase/tetratricopeptide (TPR) repeat protein
MAENTAVESATSAESAEAGSCANCGRPLTHLGPNGECLRCLFDWGATFEEDQSQRNAGVAPDPLRYGHFEVETDASGFPIALGAGAMAVTYRARDTILNSIVALKVICRKLAENPTARVRFLREARAAAQIHHPNVARVTHYGEESGEYFYAMELVKGEDLETRVQRTGPLPLSLALEIIQQAARGLAAAEACGVVHRDIKPSNLMIESAASGELLIKIIDYGIAKVASDPSAQTQAGFIGTPAFASPEQFDAAEQRQIDARSDIYSLGVTFWYLLTGRTPFIGRTIEEIHARRIQDLPLQQLKEAHVPTPVISLLQSILAVDARKRPQSAHELLAALHRCQLRFEPRKRFQRKRLILIAAGSILAIAAIAFATFLKQHMQSVARTERSIAVLPFENASGNSEQAFFADGMRDEIVSGLASVSRLKVIGSKSTRSYVASNTRNLAAIGRDLGVQYVLEGTVSRANGDLRVSVRLVDLHDSRHSWSHVYQRSTDDVFALQSEITRAIVGHLHADLSPNEAAALDLRPTTDLRAYESYLRARAIRAGMSDDPVAEIFSKGKRAISLLEDAVTRDPNFVPAYCQLAKWHDDLHFQRNVGPSEEKTIDHRSLAETALTKARLLQPDSGVVHMALSLHALQITRDVDEAQLQINLARVALPPDAELETIAGRVARRQDRWDEALQCFQRALQLEPRDVVLLILLADTNRCMRRYAEFDHYMNKAIDLTPPEKLGLLPVHRALGNLESSADVAPLRAAVTAQVMAHQLDDADVASAEMNIAVWSHDAAAISRFLRQKHAEVTFNGVNYPDAWFEALAARMRKDKRAAVAAFSTARTQMKESVLLMPTEGVPLSILAIIDAGLGRKEEAVNEAMRACQLSTFKANNLDATTVRCNLAVVYAWTGETDLALARLNELVDRPASSHAVCQVTFGDFQLNPLWDPLRTDPRFEALVHRLAPTASK